MSTRTQLFEHVIDPKNGDLPADLARYILSLDFPEADQARFQELAAKVQEGTLTESDRAELEELLNVNDFLAIIQSKARASLDTKSSPAG